MSRGLDSAFADRVRLYLKVTFLINAFLEVGATALWLAGVEEQPGELAILIQMGVVTALNGVIWAVVARTRPSVGVAILTQGLFTLALNANYIWITVGISEIMDAVAPVFGLLAVTIILVLRSSLVPSPALGTAIVGTLSILLLLVLTSQNLIGGRFSSLIWLGMFGQVIVVVTTLTSKTIYGLQIGFQAEQKLGQYQLKERIGGGGMGEVYLARHALLNRPTAIKLLKDTSVAASRGRFQQEVQIASGLTHPNTVEIYDYGRTPEGVFYFAMEFVEGATLEEIVETTGPVPAGRAVSFLLQAAGSLSEAHGRGLVHRDIKPSNLMVCERGGEFDTLKVLDFGLVQDLTKTEDETESALAGTPLYLAPEVILDGSGFATESDVYALGATAYFLITGKPPFSDGDLADILSDHLVTVPAVPSSNDALLVDLVMRCLEKDPAARPRDASELCSALRECESIGQWSSSDARVWWSEHREIVSSAREQSNASTSAT